MGDSIKFLKIELDRSNDAYLPNEVVSGKILAHFTKAKKIRGLRIVVLGEAVVKWSDGSEKSDADGHYHKVVLSNREDYFSSKFFLLGSNSGPEIQIPPGQSVYPFNIQLPGNLPSSFEHEYGYVRYTIKAIFDRPWKFDHEVKTAFTVLATYDLNRRPEAALSIRETAEKDFCCICICPTGTMNLVISIPASGYAPGQIIPVSVNCKNESDIEVEKVKVQLKQKLKFHSNTPRWETKEVEENIAEERCNKPFTEENDNNALIQLKVPPLPPSSLEYCGIIDLDYVLRVVICFEGMHCSVERRFPILIGTIPLYSSYNMQSFNTVITAPTPSAPLLQPSTAVYNMPFPGVPPAPAPGAPPLGFVANNSSNTTHGHDPYELPPPSYEACMGGAKSIRDKDESEYVMGARTPFAPRYPVYNYGFSSRCVPSSPSAPNNSADRQ